MADLMFFQKRSLSFQRALFAAALLCAGTFVVPDMCSALNAADGTSAFPKDKLIGNNDGSISVGKGRHSGSMGNFWHPDNVSLRLADFSAILSIMIFLSADLLLFSVGSYRK